MHGHRGGGGGDDFEGPGGAATTSSAFGEAWRREARVESLMQEWGELSPEGIWKLAPKHLGPSKP